MILILKDFQKVQCWENVKFLGLQELFWWQILWQEVQEGPPQGLWMRGSYQVVQLTTKTKSYSNCFQLFLLPSIFWSFSLAFRMYLPVSSSGFPSLPVHAERRSPSRGRRSGDRLAADMTWLTFWPSCLALPLSLSSALRSRNPILHCWIAMFFWATKATFEPLFLMAQAVTVAW